MFSDMTIFKMASQLAEYSTARQEVIARNIANADTPGYKANTVRDFSETYSEPIGSVHLMATRPGHIVDQITPYSAEIVQSDVVGDMSPNGNSVSLETEMVNSAQVAYSHSLAMTVYRSGLDILRTALGRGV